MSINNIAISFTAAHLQTKAELLAAQLKFPVTVLTANQYDFLLVYTEQHLEIRPINQPTLGPVYIDFLAGKLGYRRSHTFIKNELLAKAIGVKGNNALKVIDATAGLGRDSFILACLGCQVIMLERSVIMATLLNDGLQRLMATQALSDPLSLQLVNDFAQNYLEQLIDTEFPQVIYLDPMYPHRTKTALVKKELRVLRALVGDDPDADQLFQIALKRAKNRVVVKRPRLAPAINNQKPDHSHIGKQHRFDVYLI